MVHFPVRSSSFPSSPAPFQHARLLGWVIFNHCRWEEGRRGGTRPKVMPEEFRPLLVSWHCLEFSGVSGGAGPQFTDGPDLSERRPSTRKPPAGRMGGWGGLNSDCGSVPAFCSPSSQLLPHSCCLHSRLLFKQYRYLAVAPTVFSTLALNHGPVDTSA